VAAVRATLSERSGADNRATCAVAASLAVSALCASVAPAAARAIGEATAFDVRSIVYGGGGDAPRPSAPRRLAWEVRKRTSVETVLAPTRARLDDPSIFETPFLYWSGDREIPPLSGPEVVGLRRFVEAGGFVLIDDASPQGAAFDASVRRELGRALPHDPLRAVDGTHVLYRSFYLVDRPVGRVRGPDALLGIERDGRLAVVYARHDLGGAWARDNLGTWEHEVTPGGDAQREMAIRLGVNLVMYALCLDYKEDQVHVPFILKRRR
jgi:hypothetical protein